MATKWLRFKGKSRYARPYETDDGFGKSMWKIGLYIDEQTEARLKQAGIQKTVKEDDNGRYVEFTREAEKMLPDPETGKKRMVYFTPPFVLEKDGSVVVDYINTETNEQARSYLDGEDSLIKRRGSPVLIGNGSEVELTVTVYDTIKGKGQTWQEVKILDLIEYTGQPKQEGLPRLANPDAEMTDLKELAPQKKEAPKKSNKSNPPW